MTKKIFPGQKFFVRVFLTDLQKVRGGVAVLFETLTDYFHRTRFGELISTMGLEDVLEIILVAMIFYKAYRMLEGTRAITLVKGIFILSVFYTICRVLDLSLLSWMFERIVAWSFVTIPILFQPELRRALERIGEGELFFHAHGTLNEEEAKIVTEELIDALMKLSETKTGALIVVEQKMQLNDIGSTGVQIDAKITTEFLLNVFIVNTPLHDGAAIIRGKRLLSAGCVLPLTYRRDLSKEFGTRHRAAIGLSEQCDALILVVSEETGIISVAQNGKLRRNLNAEKLKKILLPAFVKTSAEGEFLKMIAKILGGKKR